MAGGHVFPIERWLRRAGSASRRKAARSGLIWDPGLPRPDALTGYPVTGRRARGVPPTRVPTAALGVGRGPAQTRLLCRQRCAPAVRSSAVTRSWAAR